MRKRTIALLIMAAALGLEMTGQEREGVEVRDVETLSGGEQAYIFLRAILAPRGLTTFATLQAYHRGTVCGEAPRWTEAPPERYGPAALVLERNGEFRAYYARTVREAYDQARERCANPETERQWYIATTFAVLGERGDREFYSTQPELIAEQLTRSRIRTFPHTSISTSQSETVAAVHLSPGVHIMSFTDNCQECGGTTPAAVLWLDQPAFPIEIDESNLPGRLEIGDQRATAIGEDGNIRMNGNGWVAFALASNSGGEVTVSVGNVEFYDVRP